MSKSKKTGIYIHIPFCRNKCPYCDFYSNVQDKDTIDRYISAIIIELKTRERLASYVEGKISADTVYFGGGTPSLLPAEGFERIMDALRENIKLSPESEITVECNPSSSSDRLFSVLKRIGVNRISLGLQSAVLQERKLLGRSGTRDEVSKALEACKRSGIDNISLDIMLGVPGQSEESLEETLGFCIESRVKHLSAYMLKIEKNTPFYRMGSKLMLPDEDCFCRLYELCCEKLEEYGFKQYEISNFAKDGFVSRHNIKYWKLDDYLGIGPSAHSFYRGRRFYFPPDTKSFISGAKLVADGFGGGIDEYIMLSLRLVPGIDLEQMSRKFGNNSVKELKEKARPFTELHLVELNENTLSLTRKGFLLSNTVIAALIS